MTMTKIRSRESVAPKIRVTPVNTGVTDWSFSPKTSSDSPPINMATARAMTRLGSCSILEGAEEKIIDHDPHQSDQDHAQQQGRKIIQSQPLAEEIGGKCPQHVELPMGEVQQAHDPVDQAEAGSDQDIGQAQHQAVDQDLDEKSQSHRPSFMGSWAS